MLYEVITDTGLEVEALDNRPGVYSARYAGPNCSFADNVNKLLHEMQGQRQRAACFRTVIALVEQGRVYTFEGKVEGCITETPKGDEGFGYDPVFQPEDYSKTFAEMQLSRITSYNVCYTKLLRSWSFATLPIKPTLQPKRANPTVVFAADPPQASV